MFLTIRLFCTWLLIRKNIFPTVCQLSVTRLVCFHSLPILPVEISMYFIQIWRYYLYVIIPLFWRMHWQPTPVLLPGKSRGWRGLVSCSPWGHLESDRTQQLHFHFSHSCIGEGNGNLLRSSYLENPRDGRLPSMGSHRVGHDWCCLAAAAAAAAATALCYELQIFLLCFPFSFSLLFFREDAVIFYIF